MRKVPKVPVIMVEATFLSFDEGGRKQVPVITAGTYMPHLVVQDPDVRQATKIGNRILDDYLGVRFLEGPFGYVAGQPELFILELMYWPKVNYNALEVGATFTIREGASIAGFGTVLEREDPLEFE